MGINEDMVESKENIVTEEGKAVICWLKDAETLSFEDKPTEHPSIGKQFGDSVRIINEYIRSR